MKKKKKKDVFISHSPKDFQIADRIRKVLEDSGISCWIAPRDIDAGERYPREIMKGIKNCVGLLLVFSQNSNKSDNVLLEVLHAFQEKKSKILPVRLDDTIPNLDLKYFMALPQCYNLSPNSNNDLEDLVKGVKKFVHPNYEQNHDTNFIEEVREKNFIQSASVIYPISKTFMDITEYQLEENKNEQMQKDRLLNSIFRLTEAIVTFSAVTFVSVYNKSEFGKGVDTESYEKLVLLNSPNTSDWFTLLIHFNERINEIKNIPIFIKKYSEFMNSRCEQYVNINEAFKLLLSNLPQNRRLLLESDRLVDFINLILIFKNEYKQEKIQLGKIPHALKIAITEFVNSASFIFKLQLSAIYKNSISQEKKGFDHEVISFQGETPQKSNVNFFVEGWEPVIVGHVILYDSSNNNEFIDLSPFFVPSGDYTDLLIWKKTQGFETVLYEKMGDRTLKEINLDLSDQLLSRIKEYYLKISLKIDLKEKMKIEDLNNVIETTIEHIKEKINNPIGKDNFIIHLQNIKKQIYSFREKNINIDITDWLEKINRIYETASLGSFAKLRKTDISYIFVDEFGGKYIQSNKFLEYLTANDDTAPLLEFASKVIEKKVTKEVQVVFILAIQEATSAGKMIIGVEHLFIALSKLCNRIILDWYDSIDVPPKYHRDTTRLILSEIKSKSVNKFTIKPRFKKVCEMAFEEANNAKKDYVEIVDILSAILREGYSMPVIILITVFGLKRDRLLGDFYKLLSV